MHHDGSRSGLGQPSSVSRVVLDHWVGSPNDSMSKSIDSMSKLTGFGGCIIAGRNMMGCGGLRPTESGSHRDHRVGSYHKLASKWQLVQFSYLDGLGGCKYTGVGPTGSGLIMT